jgi:membrane protease YdiL (CAAX protease family)
MTFWQAMISPWDIIPIGLLWGYITWRTKSLFPSVVVHGFNLWGLQNL